MNFLKEWAVALLSLACIVSIFLGYFWRMHHEVKHQDRKKIEAVKSFLVEIEEEDKQVFRFDRWEFIKRADGSVVMRKR